MGACWQSVNALVISNQGVHNLSVRKIARHTLWLGHIGDVRDLRTVLAADIAALVDLAINEPPGTITRELVYCRFPLVDGEGNAPSVLRAAVQATAGLL